MYNNPDSANNLHVVYGGQWGSEGKGQVLAAMASTSERIVTNVRVGGPNAGHTVTAVNGDIIKAQQIPVCAFTKFGSVNMLGCSAVILPEVFESELKQLARVWYPDGNPRLYVDDQAIVITRAMLEAETELKTRIGSTGEGVGAATAAKVMRTGVTFEEWTSDDLEGRAFFKKWEHMLTVADTVRLLALWNKTEFGRDVFLEGTQGYLLSLNTSHYYPFCTSRDCGPEALMAQVGVTPRAYNKTNVVCVLRTFPIRVGGNSGPLPREITWDDLRTRTNGYVATPERTTVTKKIRRIAEWDDDIVERTISETRPTSLAITFLDYLFPGDAGVTSYNELSEPARKWLARTEKRFHVPVLWVSTGAGQEFTFHTGA